MSIKITVVGIVQEVRCIPSPANENVNLYCLEFEENGSKSSPKSLPMASDIAVTVMMNEKQYNKLQNSLKNAGFEVLVGTKIVVQGEITIDMPMDVVSGDMGVITYQAEPVVPKKDNPKEKPKDEKQAQQKTKSPKVPKPDPPNPKDKKAIQQPRPVKRVWINNEAKQHADNTEAIPLTQISIPQEFAEKPPHPEKVEYCMQIYKQNNAFDKPVILKKISEGWLLTDGYARYVAAENLGLKEIAAFCEK